MRPALLLVLVVVFGVMLQVTPAFAAPISVNSAADGAPAVDGACTLREAIENANDDAATNADCAAGSGADVITFTVGGPITLSAGQLVILDPDPDTLTITGPMTISASGSRAFLIGSDTTNDAVARTLILNSVTVQDGNGTGSSGGSPSVNGGCVYVRPSSTLDLNGSTVQNCSATNGGGIYADENSTVTVNSSSIIDGNDASESGGGIYMTTGTIVVDGDSCIQNNTAVDDGGGIYAGDTVTVTFGGGSVSNRAFLVNNTASGGGGVYMDVNSTFDGNHGRLFGNSSSSSGSAFRSGGGSGASGETAIGRRCVNCCIVGNGGAEAVRQSVNGLDANFVNNWWGSNFGPYISSAGAGTGNGTSSGDGISGNGISAVDVGITSIPADYGTESTGSDSNWLTTTGGDVPSDCINDYCTPVSTASHGTGRSCFYVKLS